MSVGWIGLAVALLLLAYVAYLWAQSLWRAGGLPDGEIVAADAGQWLPVSEPLYAADVQLAGRPDYLIRQSDGSLIPVEIKSGAAPVAPYEGHVLQLAAYCLLVEEVYGRRPEYGIIQYKNRAFAVDYTVELEEDLLDLLADMRADMFEPDLERDHNDWRLCAQCGLRQHCDQRLA